MKNEEIRKLLKEYKVFQYELAEMLGVSTSTVSKYLREME